MLAKADSMRDVRVTNLDNDIIKLTKYDILLAKDVFNYLILKYNVENLFDLDLMFFDDLEFCGFLNNGVIKKLDFLEVEVIFKNNLSWIKDNLQTVRINYFNQFLR